MFILFRHPRKAFDYGSGKKGTLRLRQDLDHHRNGYNKLTSMELSPLRGTYCDYDSLTLQQFPLPPMRHFLEDQLVSLPRLQTIHYRTNGDQGIFSVELVIW